MTSNTFVYVCVQLSCVQLFTIPWTAAHQAPQAIEFSKQEYWNGLPFPTPGHLPNLGIKPVSPAPPSWAGVFFITAPLGKPHICMWKELINRDHEKHAEWKLYFKIKQLIYTN